jgi:peroxiredoxin
MLSKYQPAPAIIADSISDQHIDLTDLKGKKVLVKFHRFSGCPVCQDEVHAFINRQNELNDAGIETIVFMHSSKEKVKSNFTEVPGLHIIADKKKKYYRIYHSQFLWRKIFSLRTWSSIFSAFYRGYFPQFNKFEGGIVGVPSDFLLDEKGMITDLNYGKHFGDSWTVSDVLNKQNSR